MKRVLLLESDRLLAKNLSQALTLAGFKVRATVDAQAAIIAADEELPDLVILDLMLAGRSGIEFLYEFRSYPEWQYIPVFIFSSVPKSESVVKSSGAEQLGISNYFYKPTTSLADVVEAAADLVSAKA